MKLRYMVSLLRILKIPGLFLLLRDWQALVRMHFIFAAYESGLLNALAANSCDRRALMEKLGVKRPDLFDALLDVGLATGELGMRNEAFFIKGRRSMAIMSPRGDMLAAMVQANITYYSDTYRGAAGRLRGSELGDDLQEMGDLVARFSKIAEPIMKDFLAGIVSGGNPMRILDVGCGSGVFLQSAYAVNRNASGIGVDMDAAAVRQAEDNIVQWGLKDRFLILEGDVRLLSEKLNGPFDLITLFNVLYYIREEERSELIHTLRGMLSAQGVLAVAMTCRSRGKDIAAANLNMVNCSLRGLTRLPDLEEITSLLKRCGFGRIDIHRFMPGSTIYGIIATNA